MCIIPIKVPIINYTAQFFSEERKIGDMKVCVRILNNDVNSLLTAKIFIVFLNWTSKKTCNQMPNSPYKIIL